LFRPAAQLHPLDRRPVAIHVLQDVLFPHCAEDSTGT
jgi:hypothetical protein